MNEEETNNNINPEIVQPPQANASGLMEMLKNPYVLAMLKKNPDEVNSLLDSFGPTSKMMAMAYLSTAQPELCAILNGEVPDDRDEMEPQQRDYTETVKEDPPQSIIDIEEDEYKELIESAYKLYVSRGMTYNELAAWVLKEHNVQISPFKMKAALAYHEKNLQDEEDERDEIIQPQIMPPKQDTTTVLRKLLSEKNKLKTENETLKTKLEFQQMRNIPEPQIIQVQQPQKEKEENKKGLVRRFFAWFW